MRSTFSLLCARRFAPLFVCICTGAFNDNFFKNALIILITYKLTTVGSMSAETLISLASASFIWPFFLFSGIAGNLADHTPKHLLMRWVKITELSLCMLALMALLISHLWSLLIILSLLGVQAAFMGPVKYALLPSLLRSDEMIAGNGLSEAGTFLFILIGTMLGGLIILHSNGAFLSGCIMISVGIVGLLASRMIPAMDAAHPSVKLSLNVWTTTRDMLKGAVGHSRILCAILGISWFWAVGSMYLTQLPVYAKEILHADEHVVTLFFGLFSVGIGVGSVLCNKLLKGQVRMTYVPWSLLGVALFGLDIWLLSHNYVTPEGPLIGAREFLHEPYNWRLIIDLWLLAMCGGVFIVPLYTLLQLESAPSERARTIASNNVVNALVIGSTALAAAVAYGAGWHVRDLFLAIALLNLPVVWALKKYVR